MTTGVARFLVVEDDPPVARSVARVLRAYGEVGIATCVAEAAREIKSQPASGYLVDIGLPDGCGFDVIRRVRTGSYDVPVVVLTGTVSREFLSMAHALSAGFLEKPAANQDLELFGSRVAANAKRDDASQIESALLEWQRQHALTSSEYEVFRLACYGHPRDILTQMRHVQPSTIKSQVATLLQKTGNTSLDAAVNAFLRWMLSRRG